MDNKQYPDDEIDLRDYIEVILKRKKTILTVFLICVITATVISFLMPKVYEVSSIIKIGGITTQPLISKEKAIVKLQAKKTLNSIIQKLNLNINEFALKKTMKIEDIKETNFLKLKIQQSDPQLAVRICNAIADSFIQQNKEIYEKRLFFVKGEIDRLGERNEIIEQEIKKLSRVIQSQVPNPDSLILQNALSNYETLSFNLNEKIYSLRKELMDFQQFEIFEPAVTAQNIKPNKKLNITISAILGLMLGVFVAFSREFWEKGK